jgi:DNA-binding LacI/PurR family transcriptional regulator
MFDRSTPWKALMVEKATIATVARQAQVSRQTVSNVLNAPHLVRDDTRERVLEAIDALGYRANQAARQMRTGRSRLVAVRIEPTSDGINGSVFDRFLHSLTETATAAGYRVVLYTASGDTEEIGTYEELLAAYQLDGFILTSTHHGDSRTAWLAAHGVPFVTFGRPWDNGHIPLQGNDAVNGSNVHGHPWVDVDGAAGTGAATRHLLAAGHQRIGFIGWPEGSGVGDDRRAGWRDALRYAGHYSDDLARGTPDGVDEGADVAADLLAQPQPPTALVCASDSLALGAMRESATNRVVVTGFDDTPVAAAVGLTSVSQPLPRVAVECMNLLARLLAHPATDPSTTAPHIGPTGATADHVLLAPDLVIRDPALARLAVTADRSGG